MIVYLTICIVWQSAIWLTGGGFVIHWFTLGWLMVDFWRLWDGNLRDDSLLAYLIKLYKWVVSYIKRIKLT